MEKFKDLNLDLRKTLVSKNNIERESRLKDNNYSKYLKTVPYIVYRSVCLKVKRISHPTA